MTWVPLFNQLVGIGVIVGQLLVAVLIVELLVPTGRQGPLGRWLGRNGLKIAFLASLGATAGSLIYSNIIGFPPCDLCWFQRFFVYPQVIILGLALWRRDPGGARYGLAVVLPGLLISLYHNYIYYGGSSPLPCSASGLGVSCTQRFVEQFGYITIPLMSLTVLLIIFLSLIAYQKNLAR